MLRTSLRNRFQASVTQDQQTTNLAKQLAKS